MNEIHVVEVYAFCLRLVPQVLYYAIVEVLEVFNIVG